MSVRSEARNRWFAVAVALLMVLATALLFELACQLYARTMIFPKWDAVMAEPLHYYRHSDSEVLAYEMLPGVEMQRDGLSLRINKWGLRETGDDLASEQWRVAVLGDSVVFGVGLSQEDTISAKLQRLVDPSRERIRVFNFGLGGLNMEELAEFLRIHDADYHVDEIIFLLNPNDFSRRNSIYEGADNGMYRIYNRPTFMTPWFLRKAVYRLNKRGKASVNWYEWFFRGNEEYGYHHMREMARYAREHGARFSVVTLPSAYAYTEDGYVLEWMHARMRAFFEAEGIPYRDPIEEFGEAIELYYDDTDHFHEPGNQRMAEVMATLVQGPGGD